MRSSISPERFVEVWQSAKTVDEVMRRLRMSLTAVRNRFSNYRRCGIPLQTLPKKNVRAGGRQPGSRYPRLDVAALIKLAREVRRRRARRD